MDVVPVRVKPKLRGVFHEFAFFVALGLGIPLVYTADAGKARLSAVVFASCVAACFGASALYHRPTWQPRARSWFARLDHAGIYLLIAGDLHAVLPAGPLTRLVRADHPGGECREGELGNGARLPQRLEQTDLGCDGTRVLRPA